jgi:hypothetical protein
MVRRAHPTQAQAGRLCHQKLFKSVSFEPNMVAKQELPPDQRHGADGRLTLPDISSLFHFRIFLNKMLIIYYENVIQSPTSGKWTDAGPGPGLSP